MPTIPRIEEPRVREQGIQIARNNPQVPDEAFGAGKSSQLLGQATTRAAGAGIDLYRAEKERADDTAAQSAATKFTIERQKLEDEVSKRKGKNAIGVVDEYMPRLDEVYSKIEKDEIKNDSQRRMLGRFYESEKRGFHGYLSKYSTNESLRYEKEEAESGIKVQKEEAVRNFADPARLKKAIELQSMFVQKLSLADGDSADEAKIKQQTILSNTHSEVIASMLANKQTPMARQYFNEVKDSLTGDDNQKVSSMLQEGTVRGESQRLATEIMGKSKDNQRSAIDAARKITDPDIQDATVKEIKLRYSENEQIQRDREEKIFRAASDHVERTKERPPENIWMAMTMAQRNAADNRIEQLRKGIEPEAFSEDYHNLRIMAASTPELQDKFMKTNLREYKGKIKDSELEGLLDIQTSLRNKDGKADSLLDDYRTEVSIVNDVLNGIDIDPTPKPGSGDAERVRVFRSKVGEEVIRLQKQTGKKATNDEIENIANKLAVKAITDKGTFWDTKKRLFEAKPGEIVGIDFDEIPQKDKTAIEQSLTKRGIPVTEERVIEIYTKKLQR